MNRQWKVEAAEVKEFETLHGQGLRARIDGKEYFLGNRQLAGMGSLQPEGAGSLGAEVWVAGPDLLGRMVFRDMVRPESKRTLQDLESMGLRTVMMSAAFLLPVPLALGVAVHEGSTVLVVLNSLRLLFVRTA